MAMFALHLASGHTLQCKSIKGGTIGDYCYAAAQLILIFDQDDKGYARDPRKTPGNLIMSPAFQDVITEVKRWDGMPNRREPFTVAMYRYVAKRATEIGDPDSLWAVCANFFGAGLYGGFRLSEWAQPNSYPKFGSFNPIPDGPLKGQAKAFTSGDIRFFNRQHRRLTHDQALHDPSSVAKVSCTFRIQKNNDNGEVKTWNRNEELLDLDAVTCWLNIISRLRRLAGPDVSHLPLSVYKDSTGVLFNVTESKISQIMQAAARAVYGFTKGNKQDDEDIKKFTSHSLRVGACVILQSNDFREYEIKRLLRWRSDTFKDYLRNLAVVSKKLNAAMAAQVHNE